MLKAYLSSLAYSKEPEKRIESITREMAAKAKPTIDAKQLLGILQRCSGESYPGIGLGRDHRLKGENLIGSALMHYDELIHLVLYGRTVAT